MLRTIATILLCVPLTLLAQHGEHAAGKAKPAPLIANLGKLHHRVSTNRALAQKYFDQGLTLVYAFMHEEAAE